MDSGYLRKNNSMSESSRASLCRGADIIDLDRYMRSVVRTSRYYRDQLVVDAGGVDGINRGPQFSSGSDASAPTARHKAKRYSHDSGLSDTSYVRRRHKTLRRIPDASSKRDQPTAPPHASPSVQEFRVACEKALREQQEQIARVAQLCERLAQPLLPQEDKLGQSHQPNVDNSNTRTGSKVGQYGPKVGSLASKTGNRRSNVGQRVGDSSDTSDTLSSSLSSEARQKDKHRSDSCKTYKIIMRKLDDLNRLFASRPRPSGRVASSRSVSVCDKLVATDQFRSKRTVAPIVQTVLTSRYERPSSRLGVTHATALDIAPTPLPHSHMGDNSGSHEQRSDNAKERARSPPPEMYDLDNPVHFYEQAKRLQTLHAVTRRGYTVESHIHESLEPLPEYRRTEERQGALEENKVKQAVASEECEEWVCARCRGYWRALCRRLPALFSRLS